MSDTRREGRDTRFDEAIDRAVREMLDVELPAGLRGRVMERIERPTGFSVASAFRRKAWLAVPLAAAAVVVLAVLAPWRQTSPQVGPSASPSIAQVKPVPALPPVTSQNPEPPRTVSNSPRSIAPAAAPPRPRRLPRGSEDWVVVAAVAADDNASVGIDPLAPIAPITVAAALPKDIAPKELAISPMAPIAELQIAPLSPTDRRN